MKKCLYMAVAAIAALSSCSSDNDIINDNVNENPNTHAPVFTATIEGNGSTRTQLAGSQNGEMKVEWLDNDKVFIWSIDDSGTLKVMGYYKAAPHTSDASSATLTAVENIKYVNEEAGDAATTLAFYPNTMSEIDHLPNIDAYKAEGNGADMQNRSDFYKLRLPSPQTYNGENISQFAPMAAYSQSGTNLEFKNIASMLAIKVPASEFTSVQTIVVTTDKQMWGEFLFDKDNMVAVPTMSAEAMEAYKLEYEIEMNKATLNCKNGSNNTAIPTGGSMTFYISIPANIYSYLKISVTDGTKTKTMMSKVGDITIERSRIYNMTFKEDESGTTTPNLGYNDGYQF